MTIPVRLRGRDRILYIKHTGIDSVNVSGRRPEAAWYKEYPEKEISDVDEPPAEAAKWIEKQSQSRENEHCRNRKYQQG